MEGPVEKLFWGLVVEEGKQYKQTPKFNFHVSKAVLDLKSVGTEPVTLNVQVEGSDYILCNLTKTKPQTNLDLIFSEGEKIKFYTTGKGNVHLTGYTMPDESLGDMLDEEEDFSEDESIDIDDLNEKAKQLESAKRKNTETLKLTGKDAKKLKTNDGKAVENAKIIDIDPKQLTEKKVVDNKSDKQKNKQVDNKQAAANQQKNKAQLAAKESDSDDNDDDLSIDEDEESVDMNNLQSMMDEDDSDELDDDDLESDDDLDSEDDVAKLNQIKNKLNKPNQQKQKNGSMNFFKQNQDNKGAQNKTPQNKNQFTPQGKNQQQQKHQQTPFNKNQNQNSNKKHGTPFNQNQNKKNKSFGSQNKQQSGKKVFN